MLILRLRGGMQIFWKPPRGVVDTMKVASDYSDTVKGKIQDK